MAVAATSAQSVSMPRGGRWPGGASVPTPKSTTRATRLRPSGAGEGPQTELNDAADRGGVREPVAALTANRQPSTEPCAGR